MPELTLELLIVVCLGPVHQPGHAVPGRQGNDVGGQAAFVRHGVYLGERDLRQERIAIGGKVPQLLLDLPAFRAGQVQAGVIVVQRDGALVRPLPRCGVGTHPAGDVGLHCGVADDHRGG